MIDHVGDDPIVQLGVQKGGHQYLDYYQKPGAKGMAMGLARYLLEGDKRE